MNILFSLYQNHQGKVSDRWPAYLNRYESLFQSLRDKKLRFLEIGVQNGGSLEIWSQYFSQAQMILGCDINSECDRLVFDDTRVGIIVGDAGTHETESRIEEISPQWDIVLDDGSHKSGDIVNVFARYIPRVADGGMFIVEDLHCSYWEEFEGGLGDPFSSVAFFKRLADLVNFEHWGVTTSRLDYLADFAAHYGCRFDEASLARVHSVEFTNSLCVVRVFPPAENELGPRVVGGNVALVFGDAKLFGGVRSHAPKQTNNPWSDPEYYNLAKRVRQFEAQVEELTATVQARDDQIVAFLVAQSAYSVKIVKMIERIAKKLLPEHTSRRRVFKNTLKFAERVYRNGLLNAFRVAGQDEDISHIRNVNAAVTLAQPPEFAEWIKRHEPDEIELARQRKISPTYCIETPLFSIILPVYKVPTAVLEITVASVRNQTFKDWELCIAYADVDNEKNWGLLGALASCDSRLKLLRLGNNGGISCNSNEALAIARGEFVVLLDHDDELTPWALHDMFERIAEVPNVDFLYSDKDSINASGAVRLNPLFKPCWSPEMLYSVNYLTHLNVMRREVVLAVGGWNSETDGAQDWDLFFRVAEKSRQIERVPGIHYHWRIIAGSTATGISAKPYAVLGQLRTLEMRVKRLGLPARVLPDTETGYRLIWQDDNRRELDVVLHGGESGDPGAALRMLLEQSEELLASVTLVWTGIPSMFSSPLSGNVPFRFVHVESPECQTAAVVDAISAGFASAVILMDLAVGRIARNSVQDLAGWVLKNPEIGFAAALVLLDDETVVEAGHVVGQGGITQPLFRGVPLRHWGPFGGALWYRNVSAASGTTIAFKRDRLEPEIYRSMPWPLAVTRMCSDARGTDRRGVVSPHARVFLDRMPQLPGEWHPSMCDDPYFHPAFKAVTPLLFGK